MRFILSFATGFLVSCSTDSFNGETKTAKVEQSSDSSNTEPVATPSVTKKKSSAPVELTVEDTPVASQPVMVGGAFLTCQFADNVHCRLDTKEQKNLDVPREIVVKFFDENNELGFQESPDSNWRWAVDWPRDQNGTITLELSLGESSQKYHAELVTNPIQIGDGTSRLSGCTTNIVSSSQIVGLSYSRSFTVKQKGNFQLMLWDICGIARSNDTFFTLSKADQQIRKEFLPTTSSPTSLSYNFTQLEPGTYTLTLVPGDDRDIDDFFVNGIVWSQSQ